LSMIGELLKRQHRPSASLGFGLPGGTATKRRMLVILRCDSPVEEGCLSSIREIADAVVLLPGTPMTCVIGEPSASARPQLPVGVWTACEGETPSEVASDTCDFVVCSMDGPIGAMLQVNRGCIATIAADLEASRARAVAELGVDAILLSADDVDLTRVGALVACRRVHSITGKPVIVAVDDTVAEEVLAALWQGGVDGVMVDLSLGWDVLRSLRLAVDRAQLGARSGAGGTAATIGAYVGAVSHSIGHDDDDEGEEEEPDDD
jgi:hypothetical protein